MTQIQCLKRAESFYKRRVFKSLSLADKKYNLIRMQELTNKIKSIK